MLDGNADFVGIFSFDFSNAFNSVSHNIYMNFPVFAIIYELSSICNNYIDLDQFAYREGHNSTVALIKC